jgi:hypothetical protein
MLGGHIRVCTHYLVLQPCQAASRPDLGKFDVVTDMVNCPDILAGFHFQ